MWITAQIRDRRAPPRSPTQADGSPTQAARGDDAEGSSMKLCVLETTCPRQLKELVSMRLLNTRRASTDSFAFSPPARPSTAPARSAGSVAASLSAAIADAASSSADGADAASAGSALASPAAAAAEHPTKPPLRAATSCGSPVAPSIMAGCRQQRGSMVAAAPEKPHKKPSDRLAVQIIFAGRLWAEGDEETPIGQLGVVDGAVVHCLVSTKVDQEQKLMCYPHSCPTDGGRVVKVLGASFPESARISCRFGTLLVDAKLEDDGEEGGVAQLVCTAPPHPAGPVTVSVSFDGGATWIGGPSFWYWDPQSTSCAQTVAVSAACAGRFGVRNVAFGAQALRWEDDRDPGAGCA